MTAFRLLGVLGVLGGLLLSGCINRKVVGPGTGQAPVVELARRAEEQFAIAPRSEASVKLAYEFMEQAARGASAGDSNRYAYSWKAAAYGTWLANHLEDASQRTVYSKASIEFGNTAVALREAGVEGHYYRAIAVGLFARDNQLYGMDAMRDMQSDALRAIDIDPAFDAAGPHRLIGALYLRAPGPPTGVGSVLKAVHHLKLACELAPGYPENKLFLAEAFLKSGKKEEARQMLNDLLASPMTQGDEIDRDRWTKEAQHLLATAE